MVCESLKVAQTRQKSYADKRWRDLSFEISDFVYLKVSPIRGTRRFKVKGKLALRYVGPFSSTTTTFEGDRALQQSTSRDRRHDEKQAEASASTE
jgi:hypothetical protein